MSAEVWFPCEHPERPLDLNVAFHRPEGGCRGCDVALKAAIARSGNIADDICFGRRATPGDAYRIIEQYQRAVGSGSAAQPNGPTNE